MKTLFLDYKKAIQCRYQLQFARHVSEITFIMYDQGQKI